MRAGDVRAGLSAEDIAAMRRYWASPTGVKDAPPGMAEFALLCVNRLADEVVALVSINERLLDALRRVERHCPCGARPESLNTHPHVISCPVGEVLGGTVADNYRRAVDG